MIDWTNDERNARWAEDPADDPTDDLIDAHWQDDLDENYRLEAEDDARQAALNAPFHLGKRVDHVHGRYGTIDMIGDRKGQPSVHVQWDDGGREWFIGHQTYMIV